MSVLCFDFWSLMCHEVQHPCTRPPSDLPFEKQPRWVLVYQFKPAPLFVVEVYIDFDMLLIDCFLGYCSKNSAI